jgi:RND family efflux transporter MFP subunit
MTKRLAYGVVGIALAVAFALWVYGKSGRNSAGASPAAQGATTVAVARVSRGDLVRTLTVAAELQPFQEIQVHAKVAGFVRSIAVDVGDHVKLGDVIAVLEIPEASDDLNRAAAATRGAREEVKRAQAHFDDVHSASDRLLEVARRRPNLVAQQDIDTTRAKDQDAQAALESARQHVEESQANESRTLTMLGYGRITAPFAGVITKRYADVGALIQAGTASNTQAMPVVTLTQDSLLRLRFPVPESAVAFIREGTPVKVEVSDRRTFMSKVVRFAGEVDRSTRTMMTEVDVPNSDLKLTPGMYASATVTLEERRNALGVPVQALRGGAAMVVTADGRIEKRAVQVGLETPESAEVVSGLRENELVVVGGTSQLQTGDKVIPKLPREQGGADQGAGKHE